MKTRINWSLTLFILAGALAVPALAQPYRASEDEPAEYRNKDAEREAYRRGYEKGYDRGYAKGMDAKRGANVAPSYTPPPPPPPIASGPIRVVSGFYGTSNKTCDATRHVRKHADGRPSASFNVSNDMCGDPARGDRKTLEVVYWCGQVSKTASAREHNSIYMTCP